MSSPVADNYTVAPGAAVYAGRRRSVRVTANVLLGDALFAGSAGSGSSSLQTASAAAPAGQCTVWTNSTLNSLGVDGSKIWGAVSIPGTSTLPVLDWASNVPWDSTRKRMYACGGRPYATPGAQKMILYDEGDDAWESHVQPWDTYGGGHMYDGSTLAESIGIHFFAPFGATTINKWDVVTKSFAGVITSIPLNNGVVSLQWMPTLGAQGSLLLFTISRGAIHRFDWATQAWTRIQYLASDPGTNIHAVAVYLPGANISIMGSNVTGSGSPLFKINSSGTVTPIAAPPVGLTCNGNAYRGMFTPHPDGNSAIYVSWDNSRIYQYLPDTDTWVDRGASPTQMRSLYNVACTVPEYGIVIVMDRTGDASVHTSYVYKPDF